MSKALMDLIYDKNIEINRIAKQLASAKAEIERLQAHNAMLLDVLARASTSLGSFCSDEGWAQSDMDTMDAVDAAICGAKNSYVAQQWLSEKLAQARKDAISKVCNTRLWTNEMDRVWHQTIPDVPKAFEMLGIAANEHSS